MEVLNNFKDLFLDVWSQGISGVNITEIFIALVIFFFFLFLMTIVRAAPPAVSRACVAPTNAVSCVRKHDKKDNFLIGGAFPRGVR